MAEIGFAPSDEVERARLELARTYVPDGGSLERALEHATKVSAEILGCERVSIWMFESVGAILRCKMLFERTPARYSSGHALAASRYPVYLRAIGERREVVADDAVSHPYTSELAAGYLVPLGIGSLLDAPIYGRGRVVGVVCHEHVGTPRAWSATDQLMASCVADIVALLLEQAQRIAAEEALRANELKLRELYKMEALVQFAAQAAHDFGNALAIVLAGLELTRALTPAAGQETLVSMQEATRHALDVARHLKEFGRSEPLSTTTCDLSAVVEEALPVLALKCGSLVKLIIRAECDVPSVLRIEASRLERALVNLVANACDALPTGGSIRVTTRRGARAAQTYGLLEVADDGIGMDASTLRRIFEPYFTTKHAVGGTGLGLASVHGIVYQAGGFLDVTSEPGVGSTFTVWIPEART